MAAVLATAPLRAQQPFAEPQGTASPNRVDDRALKLKVPGKVDAVFLFRQKESLDVSLRLAARLIGMPESQFPRIEVWLLKSDGTVFPRSEKPKLVVAYHDGDPVPIFSYAFPNVEKSAPVALVMQVDGEFSVERLTSWGSANERNNTITKISYTNELSLAMSLPTKVIKREPVWLLVKLTNNGTNPVSFETDNSVRELHLTIVDSKKSSPAMTEEGKRLLERKNPRFSYSGEYLKPKEIHRYWPIDLTELFQLGPGQYFISVTIEINGPTRPIHFSVSGELEVLSAPREGFLFQGANRKSGVKKLNGHDAWIEIEPVTGSDKLSQMITLIIQPPSEPAEGYRLTAQANTGANIPLTRVTAVTMADKRFVVYAVGADEKSEIATVRAEWDEISEIFDIMAAADGNITK